MADPLTLRSLQWRRLAGVLLGAVPGFALARSLPVVPSTLLSALVLAGGSSLSRRPQDAGHWWGLIGAASGCLIGTGCVLADVLEQRDPSGPIGQRLLVLMLLALAGALAGHQLSRQPRWPEGRQPRDLLRSASGLTTGVFAGIVTLTYLHSGLDVARTFSSRLSTSLTILVITLVAPGWLSHLLSQSSRSDPDGA